MKYIEFYDYVKSDDIIYTYLRSNFSYVFKKINAWESITVDRDHILLMEDGTLIEESVGRKKGIARCFFQKSFIFPSQNSLKLKALETTEFCLIPAETVFGKLRERTNIIGFFLANSKKKRTRFKTSRIARNRSFQKQNCFDT